MSVHVRVGTFGRRHLGRLRRSACHVADEDLHRHAPESVAKADALIFGRVTYEMMEAAWRPPAPAGARPEWMEPFARTIDAAKEQGWLSRYRRLPRRESQ